MKEYWCCDNIKRNKKELKLHFKEIHPHETHCDVCNEDMVARSFSRHIKRKVHQNAFEQKYFLNSDDELSSEENDFSSEDIDMIGISDSEDYDEFETEEAQDGYDELGASFSESESSDDAVEFIDEQYEELQSGEDEDLLRNYVEQYDGELIDWLAFSKESQARIQQLLKIIQRIKKPDISAPQNTTQLTTLLVARKFPIKKMVVQERTVSYFRVKDICDYVLTHQSDYDPLIWAPDPGNNDKYTHDCDGILWNTLRNFLNCMFVMFLKVFTDEFIIERRKNTKCTGVSATFGNFSYNDQQSIETKFPIVLLPDGTERGFIFEVFKKVIVDPIRELEKGWFFNGVNYKCTISISVGDTPGQNWLAGIKKPHNRFCICKPNKCECLSDDIPEYKCQNQRRDKKTDIKRVIEAAESFILDGLGNFQVGNARAMIDYHDLVFPGSPLMKLESFLIQYFKRFGICGEHLLLEGIGARLIAAICDLSDEHHLEDLNRIVANFVWPKGMKPISKILRLADDKIVGHTIVKTANWSAEQLMSFFQFAPFFYAELPTLEPRFLDLIKRYSTILQLVFKQIISKEEVNTLKILISEFQINYLQVFVRTHTVDFQNFHTFGFVAEMIKFTGPLWTTDAMPFEAEHPFLQKATTNNHSIYETKLEKFERLRSRTTHEYGPKYHPLGKLQEYTYAPNLTKIREDVDSQMFLRANKLKILGKDLRIGEFITVQDELLEISHFVFGNFQ